MLDWLTTLIIGIVVIAIGFIIKAVFTHPILHKLANVLIIIGAVVIVIAIILLIVFLTSTAL